MTEPSAREEIMEATYDALCDRGYSELTARAIADRTTKSKSHLFYHYDSLDDLVVDFIDYLLERFDDWVETTRERPPVERLTAFTDWFLYGPGDDEQVSFHTAMLELRAQAPYNDRYRERLRDGDRRLRAVVEEILEAGIESGQLREHDPERTAALLIAAFDGARVRQLTTGRDAYPAQVREAVVADLLADLVAEGVSLDVEGSDGDA
ncbi:MULTISPECIES: TetR/AcrR family transcriptional regulator [Saliphagus]|uniref:TetR/AcrR family transcriptional regulator n=1 Tax=Saliphagus infecundisoli TaxID=1849069 RepID=A0ABD5QKM3_9EURY|nr:MULTISPECIES: TetR/AcrR family transcriptional regulator [Saliphagus]